MLLEPHTTLIEKHMTALSKNTDLYSSKYGCLLFMGNSNGGLENLSVKRNCNSFNIMSQIIRLSYIDLILTNCPCSFQNSPKNEM